MASTDTGRYPGGFGECRLAAIIRSSSCAQCRRLVCPSFPGAVRRGYRSVSLACHRLPNPFVRRSRENSRAVTWCPPLSAGLPCIDDHRICGLYVKVLFLSGSLFGRPLAARSVMGIVAA